MNQQEGIRSTCCAMKSVAAASSDESQLSSSDSTPASRLNSQPHPAAANEGNFTTLGHVIRGMESWIALISVIAFSLRE